MMSVTELERFVANKEKKVKKLEIEYQQKKKVVEGNKACIETEEEIVCKVEKTETGRTEIKEGIRGTR